MVWSKANLTHNHEFLINVGNLGGVKNRRLTKKNTPPCSTHENSQADEERSYKKPHSLVQQRKPPQETKTGITETTALVDARRHPGSGNRLRKKKTHTARSLWEAGERTRRRLAQNYTECTGSTEQCNKTW